MLIIGEKINATRKDVRQAIVQRDSRAIAALAREQDMAGAHVIDVNAGSGLSGVEGQIQDILWMLEVVQDNTNKPVAVDSDNPAVMEAGLKAASGPEPWINSVSGEKSRMDAILPLAASRNGPLVALCMDDSGIPIGVEGRLKSAEAILNAGVRLGIGLDRFYFDPLVMPLGAEPGAGALVLDFLRRLKGELPGVNTVLGLSNISFGLPLRHVLNTSFLILCMGAGLDAAILDPSNAPLMLGLRAADALLGNDAYCAEYIGQYRTTTKKEATA